MENARRSEKNRIYWNHNASINGLLVIVMVPYVLKLELTSDCFCFQQVLFSVCHIAQANHTTTIDCSGLKRCQKCTGQGSACVWSLERQACFADYGKKLSLAVRKTTDCPRVTSVTRVTYAAYLPFVYKVQVSNDVTEFMAFLGDVQVSCVVLDVTRPARVSNDTISCAPVDKSDLGFDHQRLMTYHCYVTFGDGDTILRLDDAADSYFAVYDEFYYGYPMDAESCVACAWDVGHYAYHYKWCSSRNVATGRYLYYVGHSDTDRNAAMPADDRLAATVPASSGCEDVRVRSVEPSSALWTGGVRISVTVSNHSILADGGEVTVTAAGRACARPESTVRGTGVTCVLTAPGPGEVRPRTAYVSGPVTISYGASSLTVESAQTFRLVYPEITDVSPSCGPLTGGTLLTVRGRQLNAGSLVTVTVTAAAEDDGGSPSSVPCEVVARYADRILCLTGPSDRAAVGVVRALFDGKLRVQDGPDGPLTFAYGAEPALTAGQRFEGIASGGTAAPVRGTGFACVSDAVMYADRGGVRRLAAAHCRPVNDTFMVCGTPRLDGPTGGAGDSPERLRFGFRVRHVDGHVSDMPPQPDTDGYVAHSDPVLVDFSVSASGRTVMISGLDLGRGYRAADVAVVESANDPSSVACNVTAVTRRHIVCKTASPSDLLHGVPALVVTIGDRFTRTVNSTAYRSPSFGILFFVTVFVLIALVYYCYYKSKSVVVPRFGFANTM
ncbi:plexin-A1-like [Aphis gossypii]|uniref:plexin-A1-like n=1 Tax=Aphis gossypii TaxID=80765 RepID=UPI0021593236|nr:plexin-A1-like [Aphis gossypii]